MSEASGAERTEEATPRRREEAREKGQIPRSVELNAAIMLLGIYQQLFARIAAVVPWTPWEPTI